MTAVLDRPLTPCSPVLDGPACPRLTLTTTTTTPRASDGGCPMNDGKDSCPANQATIDKCGAC